MPLHSAAGSLTAEDRIALCLVRHAAIHGQAELAPICRGSGTAVSDPRGERAEDQAGMKTYPCWSGTLQWQTVQTQRCSFFMGIRGTKHSSNHMRDLTGMVDAM